jgi:ABC-2 type transport system ATP-binding protein
VVQLPAKDAAAVEQHLMRLRQAGLQVQDVEIRRPDLEDVFLKVMHQHSSQVDEVSA